MNTHDHAFVTVDMRNLKAELVARAKLERVSTSAIVRRAIQKELGQVHALDDAVAPDHSASVSKVSIRLTVDEVIRLDAGARHASLSRGAFVASLLTYTPPLSDGPARRQNLAALGASCSELSTLNRNLYQLRTLLRHGHIQVGQLDDRALEVIGKPIRTHLELAARLLTDLRPVRRDRTASAEVSLAHRGGGHA